VKGRSFGGFLRATSLFWCLGLILSMAAAQERSGAAPSPEAQACSALLAFDLQTARGGPAVITATRFVEVPASGLEHFMFAPSGFATTSNRPANRIHQYCEVSGYVAPQNKFELKLPSPADWNQKFFFYACGGFCGTLFVDAPNLGVARGSASITSNGGHDSPLGFDGAWAANAPELQEDFGWRSTHVVTLIGKAITTHYYAKAITHSYIVGNSKGGQAVLMEAQRFPEDFDGYMPSAPVYDYTGRNVFAAAWFAQAIADGHGGSLLNAEAAQAVHKSVLQHCGAQAGVEEGLVTDPPSCKWQPEMIACAAGKDVDADCLSPKQVTAIKGLMTPATNSKGEVLWAYPYLPGTETQWIGWNYFGAPRAGYPPRIANFELPGQFLGYLVDEKVRTNVDALHFDFDRDANLARSRRTYDATSLDLRAIKTRGGKILMWHGWADGAISATSSIGYYEGVVKFMGGRKQTEDFFRLFLVPGVHHGAGGPGLTEFDSMTALENWVEKGQAPEKLIAWRANNGMPERSRPVFPYPVLARYGKGDSKQADSFVAFDPTAR
jgi:Tannase and feruloyl esterase